MNQNRFPHIAMHCSVNECRRRGRPRKRWIDSVKKDCEARGWTVVEAVRAAHDRHLWRAMLKTSERAYCIAKALKEEEEVPQL